MSASSLRELAQVTYAYDQRWATHAASTQRGTLHHTASIIAAIINYGGMVVPKRKVRAQDIIGGGGRVMDAGRLAANMRRHRERTSR